MPMDSEAELRSFTFVQDDKRGDPSWVLHRVCDSPVTGGALGIALGHGLSGRRRRTGSGRRRWRPAHSHADTTEAHVRVGPGIEQHRRGAGAKSRAAKTKASEAFASAPAARSRWIAPSRASPLRLAVAQSRRLWSSGRPPSAKYVSRRPGSVGIARWSNAGTVGATGASGTRTKAGGVATGVSASTGGATGPAQAPRQRAARTRG